MFRRRTEFKHNEANGVSAYTLRSKAVLQFNKFNFPFVDKVVIQDVYRCPRCHCDDWCRMRHNCCPDKYFEVRDFTCVNVTSVNATDDIARNQRTSFLMVKFCPDSADAHLKEKCETDQSAVDKLKYPPVTGQITGLAYANQFCSMCHDEHSIKTWGLDFSCERCYRIDFAIQQVSGKIGITTSKRHAIQIT